MDVRPWREIDTAFLNTILAMNAIEARITDFRTSPVGTGQVGDCIRFELEYHSAAPEAPTSMVGKFPADDPNSRRFGAEFGIYKREVNFYKFLQSKAQITTPDCYLAEIDEATNEFVLFMSDEAPATQGDQLAGISLEQSYQAVSEAAKLHSSFWLQQEIIELDWLQPTPQANAVFEPSAMRAVWNGFRERYGDIVSKKAEDLGRSLVDNFEQYLEMQKDYLCLVHVDFRPDNMLFATSEGGKPLSLVDWQSIGPGPAATDLGYCLAGALDPQVRREEERGLLNHYTQELKRFGAGPYDPDALINHYVLGAYQLFKTAFHSSMFVERTERGDAMFFKMINGAVNLIHDHDAQGLFE